jgi:tape measure domain-containing protein
MVGGITNLSIGIGADITAFREALDEIQSLAAGVKEISVKINPEVVGAGSGAGAGNKKGAVNVPVNVNTVPATKTLADFIDRVNKIKNVVNSKDFSFKINTDSLGQIKGGVVTYTNALGQAVSETYKLIDVYDEFGEVADQSFELVRRSFADSTVKAGRFEESIRAAQNQLERFANENADIADRVGIDRLSQELKAISGDANAGANDIKKFTNSLNEAKTQAAAIRAEMADQAATEKAAKDAEMFAEKIRAAKNQLEQFTQQNADIATRIGIDQLNQELEAITQNANAGDLELKKFANSLNEAKTRAAAIRAEMAGQAAAARDVAEAEKQASAAARQRLEENRMIQQTIRDFAHSADSSLMTELRKQTEEYRKHLAILRQRIALERQSGASKAATAQDRLQKAALKTTYHYARLVSYSKSFAQQAKQAYNSMSGMQGYARSTANIIKGIMISQMFYAALSALKQMVNEAANLQIELEATEAVFTGMFKEGQSLAKDLLEILKDEAIHTPFDVKNLTDAARLLTAYGIKAENVMYAMKAIEQATAASGDPQKMIRIARAMGQIHTKGKLTAKEVRQLTEAGIAVGEILQKEIGLTQEQLSKGWAKLNIDGTTALNALVKGINERYGTALDNLQVTTQQKLANTKESFQLLAAEVTKPFVLAIGKALDKVIDKFEQFYKAVRTVGLGDAMKTLLPPEVFDTIIKLINKVVQIAQVVKQTFQNARPVIRALLAGVAFYGDLIYKTFLVASGALSAFGKSVSGTADGVQRLTKFFIRLAAVIFIIKAAMLAWAFATKAWAVVSLVFKGVMMAATTLATIISSLPAFFAAAAAASAAPWMAVASVLLMVGAIAAGLIGKFGEVKDAITGVKTALSNIKDKASTGLGKMFTDLGDGLNDKIDDYNKKLAEDQEKFNNEFEGSGKAIEDSVDGASKKTKKAMEGLMSFDEVYKLTEPKDTGGKGAEGLDDEDFEKIADFMGGVFTPDTFDFGEIFELDLKELESALKDLIKALDLKRMAVYAAKIALFFLQMYLRTKAMTAEKQEQLGYEKQQTAEDTEQLSEEKKQTSEDTEQLADEKAQTAEDTEQLADEKAQTAEDAEQLADEKAQTAEDAEQLADEKAQTAEDAEQLANEKKQTAEDAEQLANEKKQTAEDAEQLANEKKQTAEDMEQHGASMAGGGKGGFSARGQAIAANAAGVGINLVQLTLAGMAIKDSLDEIKEKRAKGEEVTWKDYTPLVTDILFGVVDIFQLVSSLVGLVAAIKMGKAVAGGVSAVSKVASMGGGLAGSMGGIGGAVGGGGIMAALGPVMGPILGIAAAAAAIAAILYIIVKWGPQIIEFLQGLFTAIGQLLKDVAEAVSTIILALGESVAEVISAFWGGIADLVTAYFDGISDLVVAVAEAYSIIVSALSEGIAKVIKSVLDGIANLVKAIALGIAKVIDSFFNGLDRLMTHFDPIINAVSRAIDNMSEALAAPLNGIGDILKSISRVIDVIADNLPNWINRLITAIGNISINVAMPGGSIVNHAKGGIAKKGTGLVVNAATVVGSHRYGEAGAEAIIPLERSSAVDMFAEKIAVSIAPLIPAAAEKMNSQFTQAQQAAAMGGALIPSAGEIAGAIKSFLTPQLQAVVDTLAQIEPVQVNNPMFIDNQGARKLAEKIESVRGNMGARGRVSSKFIAV